MFSILLVAVQFASAQLTPRILKTGLTDPFTKFALGVFSGTAVYGLIVMSRVTDDFVPQTAMALCVGLLLLTMLMFPVFIHHIAPRLASDRVLRATSWLNSRDVTVAPAAARIGRP